MRDSLVGLGVAPEYIFVERHSIDTTSNFLRSELEGHFGDSRPVAIVAQPAHLIRMISIIAPRTLRRPYLGVVVPETEESRESRLVSAVSAMILACLPSDACRAIRKAERRATGMWHIARLAGIREYP